MRTLKRHARRIDEAQPHRLIGDDVTAPTLLCALAVDEIAQHRAGHVGNVGRVHPHPRPAQTIPTPAASGNKIGQRLGLAIVIARIDFQRAGCVPD
jgi:hypothetical protein